jgi:RNA polymerase sigma factor (sigma-70 family)
MGERTRRAAWVASRVMPHEPNVRLWLAKSRVPPSEIDDLIQQGYCRLAELKSTDGIANPGGYFLQVVRSQLQSAMRRARIVSMETVAEIESLNLSADEPSPERVVEARAELEEVLRLMDKLPARCRKVLELRKIHGLSQREIAARLGITEAIVENDVVKGLRLISQALRGRQASPARGRPSRDHERVRIRRPD